MAMGLDEYIRRLAESSAATFDEYPDFTNVIQRIDDAYDRVLAQLGRGTESVSVFAAMSHAAFIAAAQQATSGQLPPAFMTMRGCVEDAIYAFYLFHHPELKPIWSNRQASDDAKKRVRREFQLGKMKEFLTTANQSVGEQVDIVYELSIDFGAHPNALAFYSHLVPVEGSTDHVWQYVNRSRRELTFTLRMVAMAGMAALNVFKLIFPITFVSTGGSDVLTDIHRAFISLPEEMGDA